MGIRAVWSGRHGRCRGVAPIPSLPPQAGEGRSCRAGIASIACRRMAPPFSRFTGEGARRADEGESRQALAAAAAPARGPHPVPSPANRGRAIVPCGNRVDHDPGALGTVAPDRLVFGAEPACKPGSVVDSHSSRRRVTATLKQPTRRHCGPQHSLPIWSCSRWGLPCRSVTRLAVRSYRTISPLPRASGDAVRRYLSVALSVGSRRPGVTWHRALWSPDFPRHRFR